MRQRVNIDAIVLGCAVLSGCAARPSAPAAPVPVAPPRAQDRAEDPGPAGAEDPGPAIELGGDVRRDVTAVLQDAAWRDGCLDDVLAAPAQTPEPRRPTRADQVDVDVRLHLDRAGRVQTLHVGPRPVDSELATCLTDSWRGLTLLGPRAAPGHVDLKIILVHPATAAKRRARQARRQAAHATTPPRR